MIEPGQRRGAGQFLIARIREANAVPAAHPQHRGRHAAVTQDVVVGDGFVEREQRVDRALLEQGRRVDLADEVVARPSVEEPLLVGRGQRARCVSVGMRARDVRIERAPLRGAVEQVTPPALDGLGLVETGSE